MNKKGFTLAEVLITLTIVGVIAALVIPALIQSAQDNQYKTAWKNAYSSLNQATQRIVTENGGSLKGLFSTSRDIRNAYSSYFSYTKSCNSPSSEGCSYSINERQYLNGTNDGLNNVFGGQPALVLNNGTLIIFIYNDINCATDRDFFTNCGWIYIDTNGLKKPNTVGKDIYYVWLLEKGIKPFGYLTDTYAGTCRYTNTGMGCAAKYLMQ